MNGLVLCIVMIKPETEDGVTESSTVIQTVDNIPESSNTIYYCKVLFGIIYVTLAGYIIYQYININFGDVASKSLDSSPPTPPSTPPSPSGQNIIDNPLSQEVLEQVKKSYSESGDTHPCFIDFTLSYQQVMQIIYRDRCRDILKLIETQSKDRIAIEGYLDWISYNLTAKPLSPEDREILQFLSECLTTLLTS